VTLPFLDRAAELERLARTLRGPRSLTVLYGRRRLGKSRLLRESLRSRPHVHYVGDARDAPLQRHGLAAAVAERIPGFADVPYPDWESLLRRLYRDAPHGLPVVIDELPEVVLRSPELPSVLSKVLDGAGDRGPHLLLAGSSQRMMHGLVLDASAPLYGRAAQIMKIEPLGAGWLGRALEIRDPRSIVETHALWGGVPRYWELARGIGARREALEELVLDPLGVLHREPDRLLADDIGDPARAASILALVGRGCHRGSEIASRLALPATSIARPLANLVDLGLLERQVPFGRFSRDTKRTAYVLADPFLRAWYRFVEPNRSRLAAGQVRAVSREIEASWPEHTGGHWESLVRSAVPRLDVSGGGWGPASRWWGRDRSGAPLELDVVAESRDGRALVGEAKRTASGREVTTILESLLRRAAACPELEGRRIEPVVFVMQGKGPKASPRVVDARDVLGALR